ncbi:glyoxylase-like metal-dependent hydrolase (beta-lactamase superfamily II) [Duganella sp. 1224]|uniref:MBL fold metallo-hydrolase n=1 Tax=Duganella sp. 1224 TaxID=2587052 RepID=UPI0015CBD313|nr:MBL fold metallo-hydrolase [Duganella sp. 1224]NYE63166.1 glyoxylase-like metal-dependent hydrolase (beta-lactamase superfamily II) [Duganella sp. 1224]
MRQFFPPAALRRTLLAAVCGLTLLQAHAAAPLSTIVTPGYARVMVGDFEVTPLSDGTADLPMVDLLQNDKAATQAALAKAHLGTPTTTSTNAFLVNTGKRLVLVDTGSGALFGPTLGKLVSNLKASGYQPEQVDDILITHFHPDHVGGLAANGQIVFPNAVVHADQRDADYWLDAANKAKAPKDFAGFFDGAEVSLRAYIKAGKFQPFDHNGEVVPGISSYSSYGHTAGHTSYVVESKGKKLVILGDLIHVGAVQFDKPSVTIAFDSDGKQAYAARTAVFGKIAKEDDLVAAAHLQFPGIGYIRANGKSWTWTPANYTVRP